MRGSAPSRRRRPRSQRRRSRPAPAKPAAPPAQPLPTIDPAYVYEPAGRRDPFISLLGRGEEARADDGAAAGLCRAADRRGHGQGRADAIAAGSSRMLQAPDNKTYIVRTGDKLLDGTREIDQPGEGHLLPGRERPAVARQAAGSAQAGASGRRAGLMRFERVETTMIANSEDKANAHAHVRPADDGGRARRDRRDYPERHRGASAPGRRTSQGDAVLIEATEPVAYSVSRPDALSLVVDMRNVSVSDARADVDRQGAIAGVRLEQATARRRPSAGARARRRWRSRPSTSSAARATRSASSSNGARAAPAVRRRRDKAGDAPGAHDSRRPRRSGRWCPPRSSAPQPPAAPPSRRPEPREDDSDALARRRRRSSSASSPARHRARRRSRSSATAASTPMGVTESKDRPRRLVLDFPNVTSKAPTPDGDRQPPRDPRAGGGEQPPAARDPRRHGDRRSTSYHVERSGEAGRDLAVVFEQAKPCEHRRADAGRGVRASGRARAADHAAAGDGQRRRDHQAGARLASRSTR